MVSARGMGRVNVRVIETQRIALDGRRRVVLYAYEELEGKTPQSRYRLLLPMYCHIKLDV